MIVCRGVRKSYRLGDRSVEALRGLDLEIDRPGFFAIMGQSGSGKSTLLHLLGSLDRPDAGEIIVAGHAVHAMSEREATEYRRRDIGIVFQGFNLIPTMTAVQNVELPGVLAGDLSDDLRDRARALLTRLGVGDRADHRPEALSGGEQQRVAIARALLYKPPVILADEPTGNLDSASSEGLWMLLGEVAREHETTVVMVTHEPTAAAHCERVFVIRDGLVHGIIERTASSTRDNGDGGGLGAAGVAAEYQRLISSS